MSEVVKLKPTALKTMRRSPEVRAELKRKAALIAVAAGPGHVVDSQRGPQRARASVRTGTYAAMWREAKRRTLTIAFGAGRG